MYKQPDPRTILLLIASNAARLAVSVTVALMEDSRSTSPAKLAGERNQRIIEASVAPQRDEIQSKNEYLAKEPVSTRK
jgi:hypothetical protein